MSLGEKSKLGRMPVTREMRELVVMLRRRYSLRELGKIAGVNFSVLFSVENGSQKQVSEATCKKIMGLSDMVTAEDRRKAEAEKKAAESEMTPERFRLECRKPEFLKVLRRYCTNYRALEPAILKIRSEK